MTKTIPTRIRIYIDDLAEGVTHRINDTGETPSDYVRRLIKRDLTCHERSTESGYHRALAFAIDDLIERVIGDADYSASTLERIESIAALVRTLRD